MKRLHLHFAVSLLTFVLSLGLTIVVRQSFSQKVADTVLPLQAFNLKIQQQIANEPSPEQVRESSVSPYEIKKYIAEHKGDDYISLVEFWQRLGIETEEWEKYQVCNSRIFKLQLDSEPGDEVMLRLYEASASTTLGTRYLIFKPVSGSNKTDWRFLGYIDFVSWYDTPEYRIVTAGNYRWLVFTAATGHGSAYGLSSDEWYEIGEHGAKKVLSYTSGKSVGFYPPVLETGSNILSASATSGGATVKVQFSASYVAYDLEEAKPDTRVILWNKAQIATFVKRQGFDETFSLDSSKSDVSTAELETVYGVDWVSAEDVIEYNYAELAKIATGGQSLQKEWLRSFLDKTANTPEKESLKQIIAR